MKGRALISILMLVISIALGLLVLRQREQLAALRTSDDARRAFCNFHHAALVTLSHELESKDWSDRSPRILFDVLTTEPVLLTCIRADVASGLRQTGSCDVLDKSYRCLNRAVDELLTMRTY